MKNELQTPDFIWAPTATFKSQEEPALIFRTFIRTQEDEKVDFRFGRSN